MHIARPFSLMVQELYFKKIVNTINKGSKVQKYTTPERPKNTELHQICNYFLPHKFYKIHVLIHIFIFAYFYTRRRDCANTCTPRGKKPTRNQVQRTFLGVVW